MLFRLFTKRENSKGQALLLVLLSMAVILIIVLSILTRSISNVSITTKEEDSLRAFSAAEAGIERALLVGTSIEETQIGNSKFSVDFSDFGRGENELIFPLKVFSGESVDVWFVSHDKDGNLTCSDNECFTGDQIEVCWGNQGTDPDQSNTPAIEVILIYANTPGNLRTVRIARAMIDPNNLRRSLVSVWPNDPGSCSFDSTFPFHKFLNLADLIPLNVLGQEMGLIQARIRLLYNEDTPHRVAVKGNDNFPTQGRLVSSLGSSGNANRRITVFTSFEDIPNVFEEAVYSGGEIIK